MTNDNILDAIEKYASLRNIPIIAHSAEISSAMINVFCFAKDFKKIVQFQNEAPMPIAFNYTVISDKIGDNIGKLFSYLAIHKLI